MTSISSRLAPMAACSIALLVLLSGCGKQNTRSLDQLPKTNRFICKDTSIKGSYAVLDSKACNAYLGTNIIKKGYQPIYVSITNNSQEAFYFSTKNIDLQTVPPHVIAKRTHTNTTARALGYGQLAWGTLGTSVAMAGYTVMFPPAAIVVVPLAIAASAATITGLVVSTKNSLSHNQDRDIFFDTHSLKNEYLPPHATISGLIFVRNEDFRPMFEIALTNSGTKPVILASNPAQTWAVA